MKYPDGAVYEGEWSKWMHWSGRRAWHGKGTYTWKHGARLEGEWEKGMVRGCKLYTGDGNVHCCNFPAPVLQFGAADQEVLRRLGVSTGETAQRQPSRREVLGKLRRQQAQLLDHGNCSWILRECSPLYRHLGMAEHALDSARQVLRQVPSDQLSKKEAALALRELNRPLEAIPALEAVIRGLEKDHPLSFHFAVILENIRQEQFLV